MEDFRHISRLAEIHGRRGEDLEVHPPASLASLPPRFNLRRVLLSLTVVLLGMAAWRGQ
jgi:hypothetical protein